MQVHLKLSLYGHYVFRLVYQDKGSNRMRKCEKKHLSCRTRHEVGLWLYFGLSSIELVLGLELTLGLDSVGVVVFAFSHFHRQSFRIGTVRYAEGL